MVRNIGTPREGRDLEHTRVTTIIGNNGSGKSRLLGRIAEDFRLDRLDGFDEVILHPPSVVIGLSSMVHDRFPFHNSRSPEYRYLGLRGSSNAIFTSAIDQSIAEAHVEGIATNCNLEKLRVAFDAANIDSIDVTLSFRMRRPSSTKRKRSADRLLLEGGASSDSSGAFDFRTEIFEILQEFSNVEIEGGVSSDLSGERLDDFLQALNKCSEEFGHPFWLTMDLLKESYRVDLRVAYRQKGRSFSKSDSPLSSGEALQISLLARLLVSARHDALVLIDEPESGLHPEWQSGLIQLMRHVTTEYSGMQLVIATHSPYLVGDSDYVFSPAERGAFSRFPLEHRGLSVEEILYYGFGSRVMGSSLIDRDLTALLSWMSEGADGQPPQTVERAAWALGRAGEQHSEVLRSVLKEYRQRVSGHRQ